MSHHRAFHLSVALLMILFSVGVVIWGVRATADDSNGATDLSILDDLVQPGEELGYGVDPRRACIEGSLDVEGTDPDDVEALERHARGRIVCCEVLEWVGEGLCSREERAREGLIGAGWGLTARMALLDPSESRWWGGWFGPGAPGQAPSTEKRPAEGVRPTLWCQVERPRAWRILVELLPAVLRDIPDLGPRIAELDRRAGGCVSRLRTDAEEHPGRLRSGCPGPGGRDRAFGIALLNPPMAHDLPLPCWDRLGQVIDAREAETCNLRPGLVGCGEGVWWCVSGLS